MAPRVGGGGLRRQARGRQRGGARTTQNGHLDSGVVDTTVSDPLVGRVLDGRYRVGPRLARGGMATVYEALDSRLDRTIALKVMHPALAEDGDFVSRFIREAKSAARLSHPNVVAVYDQGADAGHVFLAMELVSGRTLRDLIRERGRLTPRHALEVLEPMLAALGAAHQAGIVHRDVKPENVLLSDDGRVKVADFGLARAVSGAASQTATTGILMGTVAYLSPEQVERGIADPRSDVYAAGILLYEMLTGAKPYDGDSAIQIAYQHVHENVPPPSRAIDGLPKELDYLVARATSRDPDGRPGDAHRFLAEVVAVRRGLADEELDVVGPPLPGVGNRTTNTMVVPLGGGQPGHTTAIPTSTARSGDTGPLPVRRRRRRRGWIAFIVIMLLTAGLSAAAWYYAAGPGSFTTAPSLLSMSQDDAIQKAEGLGFTPQVVGSEYDEQVPKDFVLSTSPGPNDRIAEDGTIRIVLSRGPERYAVPSLSGRTEDVARQDIEENNLSVGDVTRRFSDTVEEGRVISSNPDAGTQLKPETAVRLVVSKGVEPVAVPDVVGEKLDEAREQIDEARLGSVVVSRYHDTVPEGEIIRQSPHDKKVPKGSTVRLVVSKGPPLVAVPDVVGRPLAEARTILAGAGFSPRELNLPGGPDQVLDQSPEAGEQRPKGSRVTLSIF